MRFGDVLISMQEFREFGAVLFAVMSDERVGLEHGFEPIAGVGGLVPDFGEVLEMAGDVPLVTAPSGQP